MGDSSRRGHRRRKRCIPGHELLPGSNDYGCKSASNEHETRAATEINLLLLHEACAQEKTKYMSEPPNGPRNCQGRQHERRNIISEAYVASAAVHATAALSLIAGSSFDLAEQSMSMLEQLVELPALGDGRAGVPAMFQRVGVAFYSHEREREIVGEFLGAQPGFFVDVGANDPKEGSQS
jgi:hypothetical protein